MSNPEFVFYFVTLMPMPLWCVWIFLPRHALAQQMAEFLWPWVLFGFGYGVLALLSTAVETLPGASLFSLEGVMRLFDGPWATVTGWAHYLCLDLFAGRWIVRDAPDGGYLRAPFLALTLLYGPLGLAAYLLARRALFVPSSRVPAEL